MRTIRAARRLGMVVTFTLGAAAAEAASLSRVDVPRATVNGARVRPQADGVCGDAEYGAARAHALVYPPAYGAAPARLHTVATSGALWVCLSGLLRQSDRRSVLAVGLDGDLTGGHAPAPDDVKITIDEQGMVGLFRGDGQGFVADPTVRRVRAVTDPSQTGTWSAEIKISRQLAGRSRPFGIVAVHSFDPNPPFPPPNSPPDPDFPWPPDARVLDPATWARAVYDLPPFGRVAKLDVGRITQGLEYDVTAATAYTLIAGKDTLVRARLVTSGTKERVETARCRYRRIGDLLPGYAGADFPSGPVTNPTATGLFDGSPVVDCWIAGKVLADPGDYVFELEVKLAGSSVTKRLALGTRTFVAAPDMRLLLYPWTRPPKIVTSGSLSSNPSFAPWNDALVAATVDTVLELQRMFPVRAGVAKFDWVGVPTGGDTSGLRYLIYPLLYECPAGALPPGNADPTSDCDAKTRLAGEDAFKLLNGWAAGGDAKDGHSRDRFDWGTTVEATAPLMIRGGVSCWGTSPIERSEIDVTTNDPSSWTSAQELAHCRGQVRSASPNSDPTNTRHSSHQFVPLQPGFVMINQRRQTDVAKPFSLMFPGALVSDKSSLVYFEGFEWNELSPVTVAPPSGAVGSFQLSARIDTSDVVSVEYSARVDDVPLAPTPPDPASPYALVFVDGGGAEIARLPFTPAFAQEDDGDFLIGPGPVAPRTQGAFSLVAPVPQGTMGIELRNAEALLYGFVIPAGTPSIAGVQAMDDGQGDVVLQWTASEGGPNAVPLRYRVFLLATPNDPPMLIAQGLTDGTLTFPTAFAPATAEARFVVEASDGFSTASAISNPVAIPPRPPVVTIAAPLESDVLVASRLIGLAGAAHDWTDGPLDGTALTWVSDRDGVVGTGAHARARLSTGTHVLQLVATGSSGLGAMAQRQIVVLPDGVGDGLPDTYRAQHPCVAGAGDDPDADGLANGDELGRGTDPCNADSDGDGIADGEEVMRNSDALDAQSVPPATALLVSTDTIDLGRCPHPVPATLRVETAGPNVAWTASSDVRWLSASGGGSGDGTITVSASCAGLDAGRWDGHVLIGTGSELRVVTAAFSAPRSDMH